MSKYPKLVIRIGIGKVTGALFGLSGFLLIPDMNPETDLILKWGVLFWYITFGAIIGIMGLFDRHPVFGFPMPWWLRAPAIGGWLNFVLTLVCYEKLSEILNAFMAGNHPFQSPFWFVLEGMIIGMIIGIIATKFGGEGSGTLET